MTVRDVDRMEDHKVAGVRLSMSMCKCMVCVKMIFFYNDANIDVTATIPAAETAIRRSLHL